MSAGNLLRTEGKVAVHRWFSGGEDWACHPWFGSHGRELLAALDRRLKSREEGAFRVEALGGVLVGETRPDPACPDPKARERRPCVLRVAFVGQPLTEAESDDLLRKLAELPLPDHPGAYPTLSIPLDVPPRPAPLKIRTGGFPTVQPRRRRWAPLLAIIAGISVGTGIYLGTRPRHQAPEPSRSASPAPTVRPVTEDRAPDEAARQWERYRTLEHPYIAFLREVRKGAGATPVYEDWLDGHPHLRFADRDKPLPEALRREVEEHRRPSPAFKEAARKMAALLREWSGKPEPSERAADWPFPVIDQFFRHLVRPGTLPRPWEVDHPANAFLWRLPHDPVADGRTFNTEEDLKMPLCALLRDLEGHPEASLHTNWSTREILEGIDREMDYRAWARKADGHFALRPDEDPGPEVREGLARFQGGTARNPER
jgi:hypothetical protein